MKRADAVIIQQALPEGILRPGQLVQVQTEVDGGGDRVDVHLEQIVSVEATYCGESESYDMFVFYRTASGKTLGYSLEVKNWWRVHKSVSGPNTTVPVQLFVIT